MLKLISDKLPGFLTEKQKEDRIRNYLSALREEGVVKFQGSSRRKGFWILINGVNLS